MASRPAKYHNKRGRQTSTSKDNSELLAQKGARHSPCRRSVRLSQRYPFCEQETKHLTSRSLGKTFITRMILRQQLIQPKTLHGPPISSQQRSPKHKRLLPEPERPSDNPDPPSKRPRTDKNRLVEHWTHNKFTWPEKLSEPNTMEHFLARPNTPSLRRTKSNGSLTTASETSSREAKSRPYTNKNYDTYLETKGCFMYDHDDGIDSDSKSTCRQILSANPKVPKGTVFEQCAFESTCRRLQKKNEAGVTRIIGELIVPSAESAIDLSHVTFPHLVVSVNEGWDSSISLDEDQRLPPLAQTPLLPQSRQFRLSRPQPDYAVGFPRQSFSEDQLEKLAPFVGEIGDMSFFMSTAYMYFPFMTVEVKCGKAALDIADRQNAHSMTLSVRGVVKLFRVVKREKELNRQILSFSISHDHRMVRIYGHYPVIDGNKTTYYRHPIHEFSFAALDGKEKWTCYKFVMGVYDDWAPSHFKRLCSAINELPEIKPDVSQHPEILPQPEPGFSESTGLSQGIEGVDVQDSSFTSVLEEEAQPSPPDSPVPPSGPPRENEGKSSEAFKLPQKRRK
ncbi:conserved hypothetical protein [Histoplasma mississippiense (nom. inval.)]|uniref:conserved hypothetical protein n=1 Tax=Ajellomyces capsulatus (strain NAm1 / WU24) TaxID=2059318 RepID=UPI000157D0E8|nr:conserved hypothetical protein [Histoplasma mississippiense (nom. inval.)]EDN11067.1 conserved hypothetical protein [Histoplasma mississippiense (nom. inval.)]